MIVVDIDPRNGGRESLKKLTKPPKTVVAETGGGGRHYFCDYSPIKVAHKPVSGIDIQSDNQIVVLPPSRHASGNRYKWLNQPASELAGSLGELPKWATHDISESKDKPNPEGEWLYEGARNTGLTSIAGRWRRTSMAEAEMFAALRIHNRKWCVPPLNDNEVSTIVHSLMSYTPAAQPSTPHLFFDKRPLAYRVGVGTTI